MDRLGKHDLARIVAGDGSTQLAFGNLAQGEPAGGNVHGGDAVGVAGFRELAAAESQEDARP